MLFSPVKMHIPDGFLSPAVAIFLWIVSIAVVAYTLRRVGKDLGERQVPLMGVLAAAIFAGQMLNFAVAGGTSGHLLGAAIAVILLGPWPAILVMTSVVSIQALIFQDGGLLVLGANIFNMAIVAVAVAYAAYQPVLRLAKGQRWGILAGGFLAGWLAVFISALAAALELAISGTSPANLAIPAMAVVHALIGIGEGLITVGALAFIYATRRDLLAAGEASQGKSSLIWVVGLLLALGLAIASPLASTHPDGLKWIAAKQGFLHTAQGPIYKFIPGYLLPGVSNHALATILAAVVGTLIVFGVVLAVAFLRRNRSTTSS